MEMQHRRHSHRIVIDDDSDEIVEVDGQAVSEGYVTRARNGELLVCLSDEVCDKD